MIESESGYYIPYWKRLALFASLFCFSGFCFFEKREKSKEVRRIEDGKNNPETTIRGREKRGRESKTDHFRISVLKQGVEDVDLFQFRGFVE